jgi:hypothetical protein
MIIKPNGTMLSDSGNIVHFGIEDFINKICIEDNCFLCGASRTEKEFNYEHIIPKWLLRKYNLFDKYITLPNGGTFRYDRYTIPCCKRCNTLLGEKLENKVSDAFSKDYKYLQNILLEKYQVVFIWMALIFLKTHLKDKVLKEDFKTNTKISDYYDWETLHHIHCLVRAICFDIAIDLKALGTIIVLPAKKSRFYDVFDYTDIYYCKTMLIKFEDVAILAVLNDSCACMNILKDILTRIKGPLNPLQLRELVVRFAHCNISLINRPIFYTNVDIMTGKLEIGVKHSNTIEMKEYDQKEYGEILYYLIRPMLEHFKNENMSWVEAHLKEGDLSYLFDEKGLFNTKSIIFKDDRGNEVVET